MFSRAVRLFNIMGFEIRVDPSWLLIAAMIVWSLSAAWFPAEMPGLGQGAYLAMAVIAMLGLFAGLVLHELAHSLVARHFGLRIGGITLFIFGGVAELEKEPASAKSEFWIAIAGPITSFAIAAVAFLAGKVAMAVGLGAPVAVVLNYLGLINLILAIFNLIPAFPLDGGRVLRAALWRYYGDVLRATRIAAGAGSLFAYVLMGLGLLSMFGGGTVGGLWQILIGLFLLTASRSTYQQVLMKTALKGRDVGALMTRDPWTVEAGDTLQGAVENVMLRHGLSFVPVLDGGRLAGYLDIAGARAVPREDWAATRVAEAMITSGNENTVTMSLPSQELMERIVATGRRKFLVADRGRLRGVVSLSDLMSYIAVLQELHANGAERHA
jgi:Zn-dependent protease/CBS domain-containing protein